MLSQILSARPLWLLSIPWRILDYEAKPIPEYPKITSQFLGGYLCDVNTPSAGRDFALNSLADTCGSTDAGNSGGPVVSQFLGGYL